MHRRDQEAQFLRQFLAHPFNTVEQFTALALIHHRNKPVTDLKANGIDGLNIIPVQLFLFISTNTDIRAAGNACLFRELCRLFLHQPPGTDTYNDTKA